MKTYQKILVILNMWRIIPCYLFLFINKFKEKTKKDLDVWSKKHNMKNGLFSFGFFMIFQKEIRNLLLNRLHRNPLMFIFTRILFTPEKTLFINMSPENIGGGMYIQHGFATIISAKKIGENFHVNQQVTIGFNSDQNPIIKDNVTVCAGAIIIGGVTIKNNSTVGAGAVVVKDVEENDVVVGVPAQSIKKSGE